MADLLKYDELQKENGGYKRVPLIFDRVYPRISGTISSQAYSEVAGLTLVTFFDEKTTERFNSLLDNIDDTEHKIHRTRRLHCTMIGLLTKSNQFFDELVQKEVNKFFNSRSKEYEIQFKLVRPGKWVGKDKSPIPYASDGTIIAYGEPCDNSNTDFINTGDELALHLKNELPSIFDKEFERRFPTIWSTLGHYKEDFMLKNTPLIPKFEGLRSDRCVSFPIKITKLELVRFYSKDLEYSESIATVG